jgi:hypothetical protein
MRIAGYLLASSRKILRSEERKFMAAPDPVFHPPYLHYDKPADLAQIQDRVETLRESAYAYQRQHLLDGVGHATFSAHIGRIQTGVLPIGATPGAASKAVASPAVNVSPSGVVTMGFNCKAMFHATNNLNCMFTYWDIFFKDHTTGGYTLGGQYLGETYWPNHKADYIDFEIDWDTYSKAAYLAPDKTARFVIRCRNVLTSVTATSAEVVLDFTSPPCIDLYSVSLNENTFIGSENGNDPTMTVVLSAPAPPGGQRIYLSVSSTKNAGILGNNYFDISAGQSSGAISGFLGTQKVLQDQTVDIHVNAGGNITGYATVYLHKKKKG